jgi:hypothetical protein
MYNLDMDATFNCFMSLYTTFTQQILGTKADELS